MLALLLSSSATAPATTAALKWLHSELHAQPSAGGMGLSGVNFWGKNGRRKAQDSSGLCENLRELLRAQEQQMCH